MTWLLVGFALLLTILFAFNAYTRAAPQKIVYLGKWVLSALAVILGVFLVATGRFGLLWMILLGLLPWIGRYRAMSNIFKTMRGPSAGQASTVRTRYLAMTLEHDTGNMDGEVLIGDYAGQRLSQLGLDALQALLRETRREDARSASLLEAYLDRMHGAEWRGEEFASGAGEDTDEGFARGGYGAGSDGSDRGSGGGAGGGPGGRGRARMTRQQAYEILGLSPGADEAAIRSAHRRLMKMVHPDRGGSDYLAAQINEAKDVLLRT